ncbi:MULTISPECIES: hypothetical protein [unclassified Halomonas]|uniref:hypothetical protein n=1 Tax=unclassified Halomonas TaxID=2609666 RepID=UPI00099045D8|nr:MULTISPECIES: hypothetical protein [unclassified Halomonas]AQU81512.1 hypothetical protein B2G49_02165 [Halomonas sp. 'Soap Lake \
MNSVKFELSSDYGCLALLDISNYSGFVSENWELDQLKAHICNENAKGHIVAWGCTACNWNIEVHFSEPTIEGNRAYRSFIETEGELLLTTYDSITMAAQFSETVLPEPHEKDQVVKIGKGIYEVTVVQNFPTELINTEELWELTGSHYIVFINKALENKNTKGELPWFAA